MVDSHQPINSMETSPNPEARVLVSRRGYMKVNRKAVLVALVLAAGSRLPAQSIQGSILGSVRDATGAAVPGASVVITDVDTSVHTTLTTDGAGDYQALNLTADHYTVQVTATGFEAKMVEGLTLTARQQLREDISLTLGSVGQEVTVSSGDAGVIATDTPSIDASLPAIEVRDLPANYRASVSGTSPLSIIQVLPGVQADNSGNFSVQGGLPFQTEVSVDGVTVQNTTSNTPIPDAFPSGDSIAEIRVDGVLNNAEFGQPGEVTTITKSGTNSIHGAAFYYHQDSGEAAKPFGALNKPKLVTNDFGGSVGGPVFIPKLYNGRDRTFFFGTYEGYRSPRTGVVQYSVPTVAMKQGNFSGVQGVKPLTNPFTGGTYANETVPISTSSAAFLSLFPDPNFGNTAIYVPGAINYIANENTSLFSNQFDLRGDEYLGKKALIFARFTWKNINQSAPTTLLVPPNTNSSQNRVIVAAFNYNLTPRLLNEARFGATLNTQGTTNPFDGPGFVGTTGLQGLQNLFYNGVPELDFNFLQSENADRLSSTTKSRTYEYTDSLSWVKGQHNVRVGGDIRHIEAVTPLGFNGSDNYGTFDYTSAKFTGQEFADFLIGAPNQTFYDVVQSDNDGKTLHYAFYAQDQWKATQNLTLSYGLRYEFHPAYHDPSGNIGNFDPTVAKSGRVVYPTGSANLLSAPFLASFNSCGVGLSTGVGSQNGAPCTPTVDNGQAGLPSGLRTAVKDRFMPRVGFAYRLGGNNRTTVRGGFGLFNITLLGANFYSLTGTLQADTVQYTNQETATGPAYTWPKIFVGTGSAAGAPTYGQAYFGTANDINWRDPYSEQASLSVDHDLGSGFGARISYIGLITHHLVWAPNLNDLPYSTTISAYNQPLSARPFPNWGRINTRSTGADANYQSLQIDIAHHQSKGLTFDSTYTLAKNISDNQGPGSTSFAGENGGSRASYAGTPRVDFGQVYGTRRNRWLTTMVYQLPIGRSRQFGGGMPRALDLLVGGWQTSNIFLWQSGPFLTPYFPSGQGDPSGTGSGLNGGLFGDLGHRSQNPDRVGNPVPQARTRNGWISSTVYVCPGEPGWVPGTPCTTGSGQPGAPPPIGRFGNAQDGSVAGPGTVGLSSGLSKTFALTERVSFRAEGTFTNVFNHTNLGNPNLNISSGQFGVITTTQTGDFGGPRTGQISARLQF